MVLVLAGVPPGADESGDPEPVYVGQAKCRMCHRNEHKIWSESAHAGALDPLEPEDRQNAECLVCPTTGYGERAAPGADLTGVQCEACHGPGSLYKSMTVMSKARYEANREKAHRESVEAGLRLPEEDTCTGCHNPESPTFQGFDFDAARATIEHWD